MSLQVNKLTNGNCYVDNKNFLGKADEIELPMLKVQTTDHNPLGLAGVVQYPTKMDKMEGKIKWNCFYSDVLKKFANPYKSLQLMFRGNLEGYVGSDRTTQDPYVLTMTINSKGVPGGSIKPGDNAEAETEFSATYMKLEIARQTIYEFDAVNNIFFVDGVDLLKEFRDNIGQ
jgi:P2 family phage contractile tail tube protein